jgi:hypothetical protein
MLAKTSTLGEECGGQRGVTDGGGGLRDASTTWPIVLGNKRERETQSPPFPVYCRSSSKPRRSSRSHEGVHEATNPKRGGSVGGGPVGGGGTARAGNIGMRTQSRGSRGTTLGDDRAPRPAARSAWEAASGYPKAEFIRQPLNKNNSQPRPRQKSRS